MDDYYGDYGDYSDYSDYNPAADIYDIDYNSESYGSGTPYTENPPVDDGQEWDAPGAGYTPTAGTLPPAPPYTPTDTSWLPAGLASLLKSAKLIDAKGMPTAGAAGLLGGLYGALQSGQPQQKTGYLGGIPQYSAVRQALPVAQAPGRRPGSGGQRYFSDVQFLQPGQAPAAAPTTNLAAGGIASLAKGGDPRYLAGGTDGMADDLPARIDGQQEARLSHGEFVIPADVVSHLGNGNSESGAQRLYTMMEKIRKARTGNPKQGKQINPNKYLPA
jgi:hypothetical protein